MFNRTEKVLLGVLAAGFAVYAAIFFVIFNGGEDTIVYGMLSVSMVLIASSAGTLLRSAVRRHPLSK